MATIKRNATVQIAISIAPELRELAKRAMASGKYRSVSHFFSYAAMNQAKTDGLTVE